MRSVSRLPIAAWLALATTLAAPPACAAGNEPTPFDGAWEVTLTCPPHHEDDDAKGYEHHWSAVVKNGMLTGTHGTEGQPSWHFLSGPIKPDGSAALMLDGIVSNAAYAINGATRGKPYSYRVRANFEAASGTGQRVGKRHCSFRFERRG
jgi:hypothetical protein